MKRILVLGATGRIGAPVARRLLQEGFAVRGAARNAGRVLAAVAGDVQPLSCDVLDAAQVRRAVEGCSGALFCVDHPREDEGVRNLVRAAADAGVERIAYVSGSTVFPENAWYPRVTRKLRAEEALRDGDVDHVVLCPTFFMEVLPEMVRGGRASVLGKQPHPFHFVAARDLGAIVARVFRHEAPIEDRLFVHGPEAIRMHEALRRYVRAFHPEVGAVGTLPLWVASAMAWATGNTQLREITRMFRYFERVGEMGDPSATEALFGAPATTLDAWIASRPQAAAA